MSILENSSILITGGTGSFGKAFLEHVLKEHDPRRVVIFSRDELKQYEMKQTIGDDPRVRFFLGDIRDIERLRLALHGVDYVVHAAALKQVDTAEYNPTEYVKTNILGSENVIQAAMSAGVKKVVALSTDKASSPVNLYGATKLTADKLFISSNHNAAAWGTAFAVVRYGNVMGSRGSVIPLFIEQIRAGKPITMDRDATVSVQLADHITDPRGRVVKLTTPDTLSASPADRLAVTALSASRVPARIGNAAFFAPEIRISPSSGVPPWICSLSMAWLARAARRGFVRSQCVDRQRVDFIAHACTELLEVGLDLLGELALARIQDHELLHVHLAQ